MDWRSVCRGADDSCWTVCGGIGGSCWIAGIGGSCGGVFCAITCFGAPLVGARGFLGFRPLLFGMEREPAAPAGSTLFTFQDIAEYTGPLGGSRPRHHVRGKRSAVLSHEWQYICPRPSLALQPFILCYPTQSYRTGRHFWRARKVRPGNAALLGKVPQPRRTSTFRATGVRGGLDSQRGGVNWRRQARQQKCELAVCHR
jgi:hypothetical protein